MKRLTPFTIVAHVPTVMKEITNVPPGAKLRLRFRAMDAARAFIRTPDGITEYLVVECGDHWELLLQSPERRNIRK